MLAAFAVRTVVLAIAFLVVDAVMDTFSVSGGFFGAIGLAIVFGVLSAVLGTLLRWLALPLVLMTAGLFEFVINGVLLLLTSWLTDWLDVDRFLTAVGAAIILALVSTALNVVIWMALPESRRSRSGDD